MVIYNIFQRIKTDWGRVKESEKDSFMHEKEKNKSKFQFFHYFAIVSI